MIDLYTADTPNGKKVVFMLEELGLNYNLHKIDLGALEQKKPDFLAMNPNGRIPVLVDSEGANKQKCTVFESGAILYYLAEKTGKLFGDNLNEKAKTMQWVMFQMSGQAPIFGNYFYGLTQLKPENPAYIERFEKESLRVISVLNDQLSKNEHLAGEKFSIADIALYPWVGKFVGLKPEWFESAPAVRRWAELIGKRPAVQKIL